jgi:hypothetical protein
MRSIGAVVPLIAGIAMATVNMHHASVPVTAVTPPAVNRTLLVTANDFSFTVKTPQVSAGWVTIKMANAGKELHMIAVANVPAGITTTGMLDSLMKGPLPKKSVEWGGPNATAAGDSTAVTMFLPAGTYVMGCFVVSPDGKVHLMKGMMGSFQVVAARDSGAAPVADRRVLLSNYKIEMDGGPLKKGPHVFLVQNIAKETHDLVILKVLPGHTVEQTLAWFGNPPVGTPAAVPVGGTTGLNLNGKAYVQANFTPGTYVLVCWMSTATGKEHLKLGMKKVLTVSAT